MRRQFWGSRAIRAIWIAIAILIIAELILQARSQMRFGRSVFNAAAGENTIIHNPRFDLRLYRPNAVIEGTKARIETNSLGLRSPEISPQPERGEFRIAVVGASTVAGAYAATNDNTFSHILVEKLRHKFPNKLINLINAGIPGNGMDQHYKMIEKLVLPLNPSLIILYPGNNFHGYCDRRTDNRSLDTNYRLPVLQLPSWMLSFELLTKNTVWARDVPAGRANILRINQVDASEYRNDAKAIINLVQDASVPLIITDSARAFQRDMSHNRQMRLSETIRFIYSCFDLETLHDVSDLHNRLIREVSEENGANFLELSAIVPGGKKYFSDATHFSLLGERTVAKHLFHFIIDKNFINFSH